MAMVDKSEDAGSEQKSRQVYCLPKRLGVIAILLLSLSLGLLLQSPQDNVSTELASMSFETAIPAANIRLRMHEPPVWEVDDFASEEECEELIRIGLEKGLKRSPEYRKTMERNSYTAWGLYTSEYPILETIAQRAELQIKNLTKTLWDNGAMVGRTALEEVFHAPLIQEIAQVTRYRPGETFAAHMDAFFDMRHLPDYQDGYHPHDPRVVSVILYLRAPDKGGETVFPNIITNGTHFERHPERKYFPARIRRKCESLSKTCTGQDIKKLQRLEVEHVKEWNSSRGTIDCCCEDVLRITPKVGRLLLFLPLWRDGVDDDVDWAHVHASCEILQGQKDILQFWFRHKGDLPRHYFRGWRSLLTRGQIHDLHEYSRDHLR